MSFDTIESSQQDGRPIYGYKFVLGTRTWLYTAAAQDYVDPDSNIWYAVPISDDGIKQSGETNQDALAITLPVTTGPVQVHMSTPPATPIQVTIHRLHVGDPDAETLVVYSGEVRQVTFTMPGQAKIVCETISASIQRDGLRLGWQRNCPYALYDSLTCKIDKAAFAASLRVLQVDGFDVLVDAANAHVDGYYDGGFLEWVHPVRGWEFRGIEKHVGNTLTMFGQTDDMFPSLVVIAHPGCSRTATVCAAKFNNLANYGGIPALPGKSPFDGTPVFN